jgi:hypothetical protein
MFLPLATSHVTGRPVSLETMLRDGVPPNIAGGSLPRSAAKATATTVVRAIAAAATSARRRFMLSSP